MAEYLRVFEIDAYGDGEALVLRLIKHRIHAAIVVGEMRPALVENLKGRGLKVFDLDGRAADEIIRDLPRSGCAVLKTDPTPETAAKSNALLAALRAAGAAIRPL